MRAQLAVRAQPLGQSFDLQQRFGTYLEQHAVRAGELVDLHDLRKVVGRGGAQQTPAQAASAYNKYLVGTVGASNVEPAPAA